MSPLELLLPSQRTKVEGAGNPTLVSHFLARRAIPHAVGAVQAVDGDPEGVGRQGLARVQCDRLTEVAGLARRDHDRRREARVYGHDPGRLPGAGDLALEPPGEIAVAVFQIERVVLGCAQSKAQDAAVGAERGSQELTTRIARQTANLLCNTKPDIEPTRTQACDQLLYLDCKGLVL